MNPIGPTAQELLSVLQPQMSDLKDAVADIRDDTTYLRECAVRNAQRLDEHERRIGELEHKKPNGNGKGEGRLTVKEWLLLGAGVTLLGGGAGVGISELLKALLK